MAMDVAPLDGLSAQNRAYGSDLAIGLNHGGEFETFSGRYEHIFKSPEFVYWHSSKSTWQLRVFGGPGSGKVRLF